MTSPSSRRQPLFPRWLWRTIGLAFLAALLSCGFVSSGIFILMGPNLRMLLALLGAVLTLVAVALTLQAIPAIISAIAYRIQSKETTQAEQND